MIAVALAMKSVVGVVGAVAEAVDAEVAGVRLAIMQDQAGTVIGGTTEVGAAVCAPLHEPGEDRQLVAPALEQERRLGAVEPDDQDLDPSVLQVAERLQPPADGRDLFMAQRVVLGGPVGRGEVAEHVDAELGHRVNPVPSMTVRNRS